MKKRIKEKPFEVVVSGIRKIGGSIELVPKDSFAQKHGLKVVINIDDFGNREILTMKLVNAEPRSEYEFFRIISEDVTNAHNLNYYSNLYKKAFDVVRNFKNLRYIRKHLLKGVK